VVTCEHGRESSNHQGFPNPVSVHAIAPRAHDDATATHFFQVPQTTFSTGRETPEAYIRETVQDPQDLASNRRVGPHRKIRIISRHGWATAIATSLPCRVEKRIVTLDDMGLRLSLVIRKTER